VKLDDVAPGIAFAASPATPRNHWYVSAPEPLAVTERTAAKPFTIVWLRGCAEMTGSAQPLVGTTRTRLFPASEK
jgi:hypothetical protein